MFARALKFYIRVAYKKLTGIFFFSNGHVADLFLFCYERESMLSLSGDNQYEVIEAFNSIEY